MIKKFPPYFEPDHCLMNLSNSIAASFGLQIFHPTLSLVDSFLGKRRNNVVILLLDGFGRNILEKHLPKNCFLRNHLVEYYSSVFPPTTVAATTSLLSGKFPIEHGLLGWDLYFPKEDKNISVFPNKISGTDEIAAPYNVAQRYYSYDSLLERIQRVGGQAFISASYEKDHPNLADILKRVENFCNLPGRKFIYAYYENPDGIEHWRGIDSPELVAELKRIDEQVENFASKLKDTTLIITADHGHINIQGENLSEHPELTECFIRPPSLEARATNFFIREDKREEFVRLFHEIYGGKDFLLLEMREVLSQELFGLGIPHSLLESTLGDFLAVALEDKALFINGTDFVGHHSGWTREEFEIPLIVVEV